MHQEHYRTWFARLELAFAPRKEKTILQLNRHSGPLRLQHPFYPEEFVCHAYVLHPPGGVVGGDHLQLSVAVESDAAALLTTPGATKFYRSIGDQASQKNYFEVGDNGYLEWLPQETIFFPGAKGFTVTRVNLGKTAGFMGWEICCLGLPACGQPFHSGDLETVLEIHRNGRPLLLERLRVTGEKNLNSPVGLRGHSVSATFIATGCRPEMLITLRKILNVQPEVLTGITLMEDLLVARYLGDSSTTAKTLFQKLWTWLRPHLTGRAVCPPRIWAT
jgi:urease accessory protein